MFEQPSEEAIMTASPVEPSCTSPSLSTQVVVAAGWAAGSPRRHSPRHEKTMTKRTRRSLDARVAVIRMAAEPAVGFAIIVEIPPAQHAGFLQNDVLDHAA